jgi:hypothetical protein
MKETAKVLPVERLQEGDTQLATCNAEMRTSAKLFFFLFVIFFFLLLCSGSQQPCRGGVLAPQHA